MIFLKGTNETESDEVIRNQAVLQSRENWNDIIKCMTNSMPVGSAGSPVGRMRIKEVTSQRGYAPLCEITDNSGDKYN